MIECGSTKPSFKSNSSSKISNFSLSLNLVLLSSILRISSHSGGNWMVVLKWALRLSFWTNFLSQWWRLNGFSPVWIFSCTLRLSFWMSFLSQLNCHKQGYHQMTELNDFTTWLNFSDWLCDLNGNKWMHASEQQIVIIKSEQQNFIAIPDFLSTTEGCPLLRSALLRA